MAVDPYVNGLPIINQTSPSAVYLQRELKRAGHLSTSVAESTNYGLKTQDAVTRFYQAHPEFDYQGPEIGPRGWAYLYAGTTTPPPPTPTPGTGTLRGAGAAKGITMGTAVADSLLSNGTATDVLAREYGSVTAENVMKWGNIHPQRGTYNWAAADRLVNFAQANGQKVHGHTLLWHTEMPSWAGPADLEPHIRAVVGRYKGKIHSWDVVNEVMGDDNQLRNVWYRDYVAQAFRVAHETDPDAILYINDYNIEDGRPKSDAMYNFVKSLLAQGVPIHGVGFQCHFHTGWTPSATLETQMKRFAALGLRISITEFDCAVKDGGTLTTQATHYANMMKAALAVGPKFDKFTTWGFTDASTWLAGQQPLPFNTAYGKKPAYTALLNTLNGATTPPPVEPPVDPPTTGTVTAASLLSALAKLPSTVAGGPYATDTGSAANINIRKTSTGAYWWKADMDIDTDGQPFPEQDNNSDRQTDTSAHQSNGLPLNSGTLPFIVIPLPSDRFRYSNAGIRLGDSCIAIYNGKFVYAVFGDEGPTSIIGEASYAAAKALGVQGIPYGGVDSVSVTYIVFPGKAVSPIESLTKVNSVGQTNAQALLAAAGGTTPPPPPPTPEPPIGGTVKLFDLGPGGTVAANKVLQTALNREYGGVVIDGDYGPQSTAAYKRWQEFVGESALPWDGLPGKVSLPPLATKYGFTVDYSAPAPGADGEPVHNYTRVSYGGRTVNQRTKDMLNEVARRWGRTLPITQGSYSSGVSASAGTHDGGGVVDIGESDYGLQLICRQVGFAAWVRTPADGFEYHTHIVAIGDRELSSGARDQIEQWKADTNGLANHNHDPYADPYPAWTGKYR